MSNFVKGRHVNFSIAFWFAISSFKRLDGGDGARDEVVQCPAELVRPAPYHVAREMGCAYGIRI